MGRMKIHLQWNRFMVMSVQKDTYAWPSQMTSRHQWQALRYSYFCHREVLRCLIASNFPHCCRTIINLKEESQPWWDYSIIPTFKIQTCKVASALVSSNKITGSGFCASFVCTHCPFPWDKGQWFLLSAKLKLGNETQKTCHFSIAVARQSIDSSQKKLSKSTCCNVKHKHHDEKVFQ